MGMAMKMTEMVPPNTMMKPLSEKNIIQSPLDAM